MPAVRYPPVAIHDGHAEGQEGVAPAALNRVQHVKQRRALQAAAEQGQEGSNLSGRLLQSGSQRATALPDMANAIKLHSAAAGQQQGNIHPGTSEGLLTLYQLHLSAGTLSFMFTPISPAARPAGRQEHRVEATAREPGWHACSVTSAAGSAALKARKHASPSPQLPSPSVAVDHTHR